MCRPEIALRSMQGLAFLVGVMKDGRCISVVLGICALEFRW